jgi:hypothetical protein
MLADWHAAKDSLTKGGVVGHFFRLKFRQSFSLWEPSVMGKRNIDRITPSTLISQNLVSH